jgi:hypothetical protein
MDKYKPKTKVPYERCVWKADGDFVTVSVRTQGKNGQRLEPCSYILGRSLTSVLDATDFRKNYNS